MTTTPPPSSVATETQRLDRLRARIGLLCQALRLAAAIYGLWMLTVFVSFWSDQQLVASHFKNGLGVDVSGMTAGQRFAAFAISFVIWLLLAGACYSGWRLFTTYLSGHIFSPNAARWLRRLALFGLVSALMDIATRPLVSLILTAHKGQVQHIMSVYLRPEDLSTLLLLATLLALAHIQKTATDIADEHAQFV